MKMKKFGAVLLSAMLAVSALSGCGRSNGNNQSGSGSGDSITAPGDLTNIEFDKNCIVIEGNTETVIFDEDGFKLSCMGITKTENENPNGNAGIDSSAIALKVENNSSKNIEMNLDYPYVNGILTLGGSIVFAPGFNDTGDYPLCYDNTCGAELYGGEFPIEKVTSVFLFFTIYDYDDPEDEGITKSVAIYPEGKDAAKLYRRELEEGDILIHSDEYVDIVAVRSVYYSDDDIYATSFCVTNKTDKSINVLTSKEKSFSTEILEAGEREYIATNIPPGQTGFILFGWFYAGNSALSGPEDTFDITCSFHAEYSDKPGEYIVSTDKITFPWKAE
ncbi:MAG: hypothetical protein IJZ51_02705 [Ruminiclostridium sp.]|nr:hypothetical protein [Ruminiclostridium sp.]